MQGVLPVNYGTGPIRPTPEVEQQQRTADKLASERVVVKAPRNASNAGNSDLVDDAAYVGAMENVLPLGQAQAASQYAASEKLLATSYKEAEQQEHQLSVKV